MNKSPSFDAQSLADVANIIDPHPSHRAPTEVGDGIPFAGIGDLSSTGDLLSGKGRIVARSTLAEHSSRYKITENTIGFGRVASIGKIIDFRRTEESLAISPTMAVLEPFAVDKDFLLAALQSEKVKAQIDKWLTGTTRSSLGIELLREIELPKFELVQQKAIGSIYRSLLRNIESTSSLISKLHQIKAGLMHDLFTRGIGADGQLRPPREQAPELYQQTKIGWIPKEWNVPTLKALLAKEGGYLQTGPFGSQLHSHEYTDDGIPVVMPQDINDGKIDETQIARIPERRAQMLSKHRVQVGDVIIARRGELSRAAAITTQEKTWVCGTGCFLLRLGNSRMNAKFIALAYRHPIVQRQVAGLAVGSTMPSLNNEVMGKLLFPDMSSTEQAQFIGSLDSAENKLGSLRHELNKLQLKKRGLMHDLLTGKVPVTTNTVTKEAADVQN